MFWTRCQSSAEVLITYEQARQIPDASKWKEVLQFKFPSLQDLDVWNLVQLPPGRKGINSKSVSNIEKDGQGKPCDTSQGLLQMDSHKYQASTIPKGFHQSRNSRRIGLCSLIQNWSEGTANCYISRIHLLMLHCMKKFMLPNRRD